MASIQKSKDHKGTFWEVRWRGPEGERKRRSRSKAAADQLLVDATAEESKRRDPLAYRASATVSLGFVIDRCGPFTPQHGRALPEAHAKESSTTGCRRSGRPDPNTDTSEDWPAVPP